MCKNPTPTAKFSSSGKVVSAYDEKNNQRDSAIINYLQYRPVMIAVDATEWNNYAPKGTTKDQKVFSCSSKSSRSGPLNHAVLLVGYT